MPHTDHDIAAVSLLDEPVRRALYEWVSAQREPVSRDAAATAVGVGRPLAAFHLDRLVRGGLLDAEFRRLSGRSGPGAGRPAKLYRRSARELAVGLPERRYDVAAQVMAEALEDMARSATPQPLREAARRAGQASADEVRTRVGAGDGDLERRQLLLDALRERGYEPFETESRDIRFANCPFHALVEQHRDLVCGMNVELSGAIAERIGDGHFRARLDPRPGLCCVAIAEVG